MVSQSWLRYPELLSNLSVFQIHDSFLHRLHESVGENTMQRPWSCQEAESTLFLDVLKGINQLQQWGLTATATERASSHPPGLRSPPGGEPATFVSLKHLSLSPRSSNHITDDTQTIADRRCGLFFWLLKLSMDYKHRHKKVLLVRDCQIYVQWGSEICFRK